jgi:L-ascorbate metabolism protein UlaG (beta-lactamase superfamily)
VVTDPFNHTAIGYQPLKLRADIITISHDAPGHNHVAAVKGSQRTITGPGEYEIGGVFITGVRTSAKGKSKETNNLNTLYVFDYEGVNVAHLGDLRRAPSQTEVEALGNVQVALIPVGGGGGLTAANAAEVVSLLEPGIVIPMHYQTPECKLKLAALGKFLKEMGLGKVEPVTSLRVSSSTIPDETKVVVLDHRH